MTKHAKGAKQPAKVRGVRSEKVEKHTKNELRTSLEYVIKQVYSKQITKFYQFTQAILY